MYRFALAAHLGRDCFPLVPPKSWRLRRRKLATILSAELGKIGRSAELELELILTHMTQKPVLRVGVFARAQRASQNIKSFKGRCGGRRHPVGQVWSLGRSAFFLWRSPAGDERGADQPCCEGRRAGAQGPCPSVKTLYGVLLLWLMVQEGAGHYPEPPEMKSGYAGWLLLLERPFRLKLATAQV